MAPSCIKLEIKCILSDHYIGKWFWINFVTFLYFSENVEKIFHIYSHKLTNAYAIVLLLNLFIWKPRYVRTKIFTHLNFQMFSKDLPRNAPSSKSTKRGNIVLKYRSVHLFKCIPLFCCRKYCTRSARPAGRYSAS